MHVIVIVTGAAAILRVDRQGFLFGSNIDTAVQFLSAILFVSLSLTYIKSLDLHWDSNTSKGLHKSFTAWSGVVVRRIANLYGAIGIKGRIKILACDISINRGMEGG